MTEKGATVMAVVVIMLLGAAHASYGYWTERIGVKEDFAIVWSVEVEVEEETEESQRIKKTSRLQKKWKLQQVWSHQKRSCRYERGACAPDRKSDKFRRQKDAGAEICRAV